MSSLTESMKFLFDNGYIAILENQLVITNKLKREYRTSASLNSENPVPLSREEVWNKFISDAEIPYRIPMDGGGRYYTVRQYSDNIANKLIQIIKSVDYDILVKSTKAYYKSNGFRKILSNYIDQKIWAEQYREYQNNSGFPENESIISSGGNKFED